MIQFKTTNLERGLSRVCEKFNLSTLLKKNHITTDMSNVLIIDFWLCELSSGVEKRALDCQASINLSKNTCVVSVEVIAEDDAVSANSLEQASAELKSGAIGDAALLDLLAANREVSEAIKRAKRTLQNDCVELSKDVAQAVLDKLHDRAATQAKKSLESGAKPRGKVYFELHSVNKFGEINTSFLYAKVGKRITFGTNFGFISRSEAKDMLMGAYALKREFAEFMS